MHRVVITGMGVVSSLGKDIDSFESSLFEGRSGVGPIATIPTERLRTKTAGEVVDFNPSDYFNPKQISLLDRVSQFALVASRQAISHSELDFSNGLGEQTATIVGTGIGGMTSLDKSYYDFYAKGANRVHPLTIPRLIANAPVSHITMQHQLTGQAYAVSSGCSSSNHAIGHAFQLVRSGGARIAIAGGAEACLTPGTIKGWESMRVTSCDGVCRPFSADRSGLVLGEGSAIVVLERRDDALARGAVIYAEIAGVGMTADASDITVPDVKSAARSMTLALADAGLKPQDVDYINAHGTGTPVNDRVETQALHLTFGDHAPKLLISSSKSMFGHLLGAAGGVELLATIAAIRRSLAPPTINYRQPDPDCDLDYVPNRARQCSIRVALSNSFAFGGLNGVIVVKAAD